MAKSKGASASSKFISAIFKNPTPEGLVLTEREWDNEYRGTEAAFLNSGIIKQEWLPGHPGNAKKRVRVAVVGGELTVIPSRTEVTDHQWYHGFISIAKSSKGTLVVSINCLEGEHKKREKSGYLERKKERAKEARTKINDRIQELPASPGNYLKRNNHTTRAFASGIRNNIIDSYGYSGGFGFTGELIAEFDSFMARFNQMLDCASITFDQEKRDKEIAALEKKTLDEFRLTEEDLES